MGFHKGQRRRRQGLFREPTPPFITSSLPSQALTKHCRCSQSLYDTRGGQKLPVLSSGLPRLPLLSCPLESLLCQEAVTATKHLLDWCKLLLRGRTSPILSFLCSETCTAICFCLFWPCKPNPSLRSYSSPSCNSCHSKIRQFIQRAFRAPVAGSAALYAPPKPHQNPPGRSRSPAAAVYRSYSPWGASC